MHIRLSEEQGLGSCSNNQWRSSPPASGSSRMDQLQGQTECPSSPLGSIPRSSAVVSPHAHDDSSDSEESHESLQVAEILSQMSRSLPVRKSATTDTVTSDSCNDVSQHCAASNKEGSVTLSTSKSIVHSAAHEEEKQVALALVSVSSKSRAPWTARTEKRVQFLPNLLERSVSERPMALPPLRPIAGLSAYDVLLGEAMVSHAHTGNRRLLVLAWNDIVQGSTTGSRTSPKDHVEYLYSTLLQASGRFLVYQKSTKDWASCEPNQAKRYLAVLVDKLQALKHMPLLHLFQPDHQSLWDKLPSDAIKVQAQVVPIASKNTPISPLLPATLKTATPTVLKSDMLRCPQVSPPSHQVIKSTIARASTHLLAPICKKDTTKRYEPMTPLAKDFVPGPNDVICSRGKPAREHAGNRYFITLIEKYIEKYTRAVGKLGKSMIVTEILDTIRQRSPNGGFVKLNANGQWCEAGDHLAREKIGQCFRDRLHTKYSSSSKAKLVKRRQRIKGEKAEDGFKKSSSEQANQDDSMDTSDASVASSNVSSSLCCGTPMDKSPSFAGSSAQISCQ